MTVGIVLSLGIKQTGEMVMLTATQKLEKVYEAQDAIQEIIDAGIVSDEYFRKPQRKLNCLVYDLNDEIDAA